MSEFIEVPDVQAIKLSDHLKKPLTGYYVGTRKIETNKTESGESLIHLFQEKDGTEIEVWSFEMLKRKLSKVPKGCMVRLTYTGTLKDGEKTIHQVKVEYNENEKIKINE